MELQVTISSLLLVRSRASDKIWLGYSNSPNHTLQTLQKRQQVFVNYSVLSRKKDTSYILVVQSAKFDFGMKSMQYHFGTIESRNWYQNLLVGKRKKKQKKNDTAASKRAARHFNLPYHSHHNMTFCGLYFHHGIQKAAKISNKNSSCN